MGRGNQRTRKARAAKRRWLVAEHLTRAGDAAGPRLMEVLLRNRKHRQDYLSPQLVGATAESFDVDHGQNNIEPQFGLTRTTFYVWCCSRRLRITVKTGFWGPRPELRSAVT